MVIALHASTVAISDLRPVPATTVRYIFTVRSISLREKRAQGDDADGYANRISHDIHVAGPSQNACALLPFSVNDSWPGYRLVLTLYSIYLAPYLKHHLERIAKL
jgi:hypothetical protein